MRLLSWGQRNANFRFLVLSCRVSRLNGDDANEVRTLSLNQLNQLPVLATVEVEDSGVVKSVDLGPCFLGETFLGAVTVVNRTGRTLTITKVKTSCGCTSAFASRTSIKSGESTKLQVRIKPRDDGKFNASILILCGAESFELRFTSDVKNRIQLEKSDFRVAKGTPYISVSFLINDTAVSPDKLSVSFSGLAAHRVRSETNRVSFRLPIPPRHQNPTIVRAALTTADKLVNQFETIRITELGSVSLASSNVYATSNGPRTTFRLVFRGDIDAIEKNLMLGPKILLQPNQGEAVLFEQLKISPKRQGKILIANAVIDDLALTSFPYRATLEVGTPVEFYLNKRE